MLHNAAQGSSRWPHDPPVDPALRRKSRLLAAFLLVMGGLFASLDLTSLLTRPGYAPPWAGYLFLLTAFVLNRRGHYRLAAPLTLAMFPTVIFGEAVRSSEVSAGSLAFLVPGLIVASILLSRRGLMAMAALNLAGVAALPALVPGRTVESTIPSSVLLAIATGLLWVSMKHRDEVEAERQAQLRDSAESLRLALEAARMLTWVLDLRQGQLRWSADGRPGQPVTGPWRVSDRAGAGAGGVGPIREGSFQEYLGRVHADDRHAVEDAMRSALASAGGRFQIRHRVYAPEGTLRWIEAHGTVDRDPEGHPIQMRGTVFDVTGLHHAEAEKEALIRELGAKNAELERFTYTASHDLKSPLVTVRGFLAFLERDALAGNFERLRADIGRIREATSKMGRLLDELLELSRIGRVVHPPQQVPFAELVQDALSLVAGRIAQRAVRVDVQESLPVVWGDRVRLLQVVQNLVDNATKFLGDRPDPLVRIGARTAAGETVLYVEDNGIGLDPRHRERVFGLFDKLEPDGEGTGIGLAVARRIVEVHGGRIWAESPGPGHGTTFCFTLPRGEAS